MNEYKLYICQECGHAILSTADELTARSSCPTCYPDEKLDVRKFQEEVIVWADKNFSAQLEYWKPMLGVVEEVGELAHALLKMEQGIRGTEAELTDQAMDAIGDTIVYMAHLCGRRGWNLEEIIKVTWARVSKRDWKKDPKSGGEEA